MLKYVTMDGGLSKLPISELNRSIEGILEKIGTEATKKMKSFTSGHDYRGDLTKSITWRTAFNHGPIEDTGDLIDAPPANSVNIGSANDHAIYVEKGTGPHLNSEGSDEFVNEIILWAASKGISESGAWAIIKTIRNQGTDARPFAEPTSYQMKQIATPIINQALRTFWSSRKKAK